MRLARVAVVIAILGSTAQYAHAEHMGRTSVALRRLPAVRLESVVPAEVGVDAAVFTTAMRIRLGLAGVQVAQNPTTETPMLRFRLVPYKITDANIRGACYFADLALFEPVVIKRSKEGIQASTWESTAIIGVGPSLDLSLKRVAEDLAEEFAADYLAANPTKP